jgi:hypothetical protein
MQAGLSFRKDFPIPQVYIDRIRSILLTQGPIHEIFMKKYWGLGELENEVFLSRPF